MVLGGSHTPGGAPVHLGWALPEKAVGGRAEQCEAAPHSWPPRSGLTSGGALSASPRGSASSSSPHRTNLQLPPDLCASSFLCTAPPSCHVPTLDSFPAQLKGRFFYMAPVTAAPSATNPSPQPMPPHHALSSCPSLTLLTRCPCPRASNHGLPSETVSQTAISL